MDPSRYVVLDRAATREFLAVIRAERDLTRRGPRYNVAAPTALIT